LVAMPILRDSTVSPVARWLRSPGEVEAMATSRHMFLNLGARNNDGRTYGEVVDATVEPGSLIFGGWRHANVLFYHKLVEKRLATVTISYILPEWRQMEDVITKARPSRIYMSNPPERHGLDRLVVDEVYEIEPGERLYRVRMIDPAPSP